MSKNVMTLDGCEAAAYVAYRTSEVAIIYPITPSSPMGEHADAWSDLKVKNLWGGLPTIHEMQSEGGASGAVHGSLQAGSLTTTFTASQGLLLMIPNMYKIAGELTSTVFHVSARSVATCALSIFGDHSDVMAARSTGWGMLFSNSVQEVADLALIAHSATLEARIPFVHAFDGFRTSHEVMKVEMPEDSAIRAMIDDDLVRAHRLRALSPDHPFIRGTAQNPDVFFQSREGVNSYYLKVPDIVQKRMDQFAKLTGREYHIFDYVGAPDAERVVIAMGSGCETLHETVEYLAAQGEKVGLIKVRLYRPFSVDYFVKALPKTVKVVSVLDRTKEPGATGEPLYQDVLTALIEGGRPEVKVIGGRYGLSSKEFTPAMVKAVLDESKKGNPKNHFTVGINDDVTHTSLEVDDNFHLNQKDCFQAVFWGLGSDGTVGANKNSIKIIGGETDFHAQGYFVYDSKKSGARTISHLRFGSKPIHSTYLIGKANFVGIHQFNFLETYPVLDMAAEEAIILLNSPYSAEEVWPKIPHKLQKTILDKKLKLFVVDAYQVAKETGMGNRMNTILQTCFFAISKVIPKDEAIEAIKKAIKKTYGKRGEAVVQKNINAVDASLKYLKEVSVSNEINGPDLKDLIPSHAPDFVREITGTILSEKGDLLPVSKLPPDGTYPSGTTKWEKRGLALEVPVWDTGVCIQCGKCVMVCPHACIRSKVFESADGAPEGFKHTPAKWKEIENALFTIQVATEDCTGCALCVEVCPAKNKQDTSKKAINMESFLPLREEGKKNWDYFLKIEAHPKTKDLPMHLVRNAQVKEPLFEFSGACAGCGETPYVKLLSQLFGDRAIIANATGCSSIYGGNLPTTPWTVNNEGRGPAWSNSLFEDNAEFGFGMRVAIDQQKIRATELLKEIGDKLDGALAKEILEADQETDANIDHQRERVEKLKGMLNGCEGPKERELLSIANSLVKKSVWILGGDGWAYDIGYGGLDHVLAQGLNVNVLVLDTQVYSNTGGQASKATPKGAVAKFAAAGKRTPRKDLGMLAISYKNIYVAQVAMGSNDAHTLRAFQEAESYDGPSLIIAYSHCIAHGIMMNEGMKHQKLAVETGAWPLFRYDPRLKQEGKNPFMLDSKAPTKPLKDYVSQEGRFRVLQQSHPDIAETLLNEAEQEYRERFEKFERFAAEEPETGSANVTLQTASTDAS